VPYVAGEQFSVADITLLVTIGFAAKAIDLALPGEHLALRRWVRPRVPTQQYVCRGGIDRSHPSNGVQTFEAVDCFAALN
jgi:hypothetical protein